MTSPTTFTDTKEAFQAALRSLFSGKPDETESDLSKLLSPEFKLRADDETFDFAAFATHVRWLRQNVLSVSLTIVQFIRDGNQLADRHMGETILKDGTVKKSETFMFVEVADDGRLSSIVETVRQIEG